MENLPFLVTMGFITRVAQFCFSCDSLTEFFGIRERYYSPISRSLFLLLGLFTVTQQTTPHASILNQIALLNTAYDFQSEVHVT